MRSNGSKAARKVSHGLALLGGEEEVHSSLQQLYMYLVTSSTALRLHLSLSLSLSHPRPCLVSVEASLCHILSLPSRAAGLRLPDQHSLTSFARYTRDLSPSSCSSVRSQRSGTRALSHSTSLRDLYFCSTPEAAQQSDRSWRFTAAHSSSDIPSSPLRSCLPDVVGRRTPRRCCLHHLCDP